MGKVSKQKENAWETHMAEQYLTLALVKGNGQED